MNNVHDRGLLLVDDIVECSAVAAHYLSMVADYAALKNRAGMRYSLSCGISHIKAAAKSFKELEELAATANVGASK